MDPAVDMLAAPQVLRGGSPGARVADGNNASVSSPVTSPEDEAARCVEALIEAMAEARRAFQVTEAELRRSLKKAKKGSGVSAAIIAANPAESRQRINDALVTVEERRHDTRRAVFAAALEEGTSIGSLGRAWGFSRQLAARYAKEARGEV
jgi:hypothetical protein